MVKAQYKFLKTTKGKTSFAALEIDCEPDTRWSICWGEQAKSVCNTHKAAIDAGVRLVIDECERNRSGTPPQKITVVSLRETVADTTPDTVLCCAAATLWKALGYSESSVEINLVDSEWRVSFIADSMKRYICVHWRHSNPNYPALIYSEIDDERREVRKVEVFSDGRQGWASESESAGDAGLGEHPVPDLKELQENKEFCAREIPVEEFESVWNQAKMLNKMNRI